MNPPARYDRIGRGYSGTRRADPRIEARIHAALRDARTVVNVGAGTGSYEPTDRAVVAVEPSVTMLAQRPAGSAAAVRAVAETLPFADASFDAAMAVLTIHHWSDIDAGIAELRRVARRQVVFMFEPTSDATFWLANDYFTVWLEVDDDLPTVAEVAALVGATTVETVPIAADCQDGFGGAYWNRPERYLDPAVHAGISSLAAMDPGRLAEGAARLKADLESGAWDARYGYLRRLTEIDLGYRLVASG